MLVSETKSGDDCKYRLSSNSNRDHEEQASQSIASNTIDR